MADRQDGVAAFALVKAELESAWTILNRMPQAESVIARRTANEEAQVALAEIAAEFKRLQHQLEMADVAYRSLAEPGIR